MKKNLKNSYLAKPIPSWVEKNPLDKRIWEFLETYGEKCFIRLHPDSHMESFSWTKTASARLEKEARIYGRERVMSTLEEVSYAWLRYKELIKV